MNSLFSGFDLASSFTIIPLFIGSLLVGLLFLLSQGFIFIMKIIFASNWIYPGIFEDHRKAAYKEVKKLRNQGRYREA